MKLCADFKEAFSHIYNDSTIFVHSGAATPREMIKVFCEEYYDLKNIEFVHLHTEGEWFPANPKYENFRVTNLFTGKNLRGKIDHERVDYLPCFLSEIPQLFKRGYKKLDVAFVQKQE